MKIKIALSRDKVRKNQKPIDLLRKIIHISPLITDTHNFLRLTIVILCSKLYGNCLCCTQQAEPLISPATRQTFDLDLECKAKYMYMAMWCQTRFSAFDLDLWPTTLTYNPCLDSVKVFPHVKCPNSRSKVKQFRQESGRKQMDKQMLPNLLSPCFAIDNQDFGRRPMGLI